MNKKLLIFILLYILLTYLTLPLGRSLVNFSYTYIGKENLSILMNTTLIFSIALIFYLFRKKLKKLLILLPILLVLGYIFISLDRPEERMHFLQYAVLGLLFFKFFEFTVPLKRIGLSIIFVVLVGTIDEVIQWFLPMRVGDIKDVMINAVSGVLGVCIGKLYWSS
ncbi:VanZ family protein [Persephonella sp.]